MFKCFNSTVKVATAKRFKISTTTFNGARNILPITLGFPFFYRVEMDPIWARFELIRVGQGFWLIKFGRTRMSKLDVRILGKNGEFW